MGNSFESQRLLQMITESVGLNTEDMEEGAHQRTASSLGQRVMHSTPTEGRNDAFFSISSADTRGDK